MNASDGVRPPAALLTGFIADIFAAAGAARAEAEEIAANLVMANLSGHDSHGVVRTPRYLQNERAGQMTFGGVADIVIDGGAFALLDGGLGFGQVVGRQATDDGIARARTHGVAVIALRRAGHLGRIGEWAERAMAQGLASIHFVNVANSMLVAPFGGAERRMSTAPVCVGVPNPDGDDFLLDFATSRAAEGKVLVSLKGGKAPPPGSLIDAEGRLTDDPSTLYGETPPGAVPNPRLGPGALAPMGDHKGSGLAIACELLAGALTGSGAAGPGEGPYNGMLSIYIDPARLDDGFGPGAQAASYIDFVRSARPADPSRPVMIPGDPERAARADRLANGVPLPAETWASLVAAARAAGVADAGIPAL
ncbi:MAG: malate/lactate/ureidoglycolate dehydrogenase [Pseudomonadota bacterium]